jgi:hypothetical protein
MPSRRRVLQLTAGALAATSGCFSETTDSPTGSDTTDEVIRTDTAPSPTGTERATEVDRATDEETSRPDGLSEWTPEWTEPFGDWTVLGLTAADGSLYTTLQADLTEGPSAVAAVDPADGSVLWRTESEGEAVGGSHAAYQRIARGGHGVTPSDEAVYSVAGRDDSYEWTAVHALDRATGERRWSLQRERSLAVAGVADGLVVATGLEFFEPEGTHDTPDEPLETVVYGLDAATGEVRWTQSFQGVEDVTTCSTGVYVAAGDRLVGLGHDGSTTFTYYHGPSTWVEATGGRIYYLVGEDETATLHGVAPNGEVDWTRDVPVEELLLAGDRLYAGGDATVAVEPDGTVAWRRDDHGQWLLLDPGDNTLYTRSGVGQDRATAHDAGGAERWTFNPPSNNAWPEAATNNALAVTAITPDDGPFKTVYAVDEDGQATAALDRDTVFDAVGLDGMIYLADGTSELLALPP